MIVVERAVAHRLVPILWGGEEKEAGEAHAQLLMLVKDRSHRLALIGTSYIAFGCHYFLFPIGYGTPVSFPEYSLHHQGHCPIGVYAHDAAFLVVVLGCRVEAESEYIVLERLELSLKMRHPGDTSVVVHGL